MIRDFRKLIQPLTNRVLNMVARGVLKYVADQGGLQLIQAELLEGELRGDIERPQTYGHSSVPPAGSEVFCLFIGGNRDHGFAFSVTHRGSRPRNLQAGEVVLYDDLEQKVYLSRDQLLITSPKKVRIEAPEIEIAAGETLKLDCHGYAQRWTYQDGAWTVDTYFTGPVTTTEHGVAPPEAP